MSFRLILFCAAICFLFNGCATLSIEKRRSYADNLASQAGFKKEIIQADPFFLTSFHRISQQGAPVTFYIEGDGYAWVTSTRPSGNPTPRNPMALKLAVQDPSANVVYLARPCQFTTKEKNPSCEAFYWTNGRFSEEVVSSIDRAISYFSNVSGSRDLHLVGYSGGAAVAILVAARRTDVQSLRTLAGNLDPGLVNRTHGVSPLDGSLDPLEVASHLASIPQFHFIGGKDEVIPFSVVESFSAKMGRSACFYFKILPNATHAKGWVESWPALLRQHSPR